MIRYTLFFSFLFSTPAMAQQADSLYTIRGHLSTIKTGKAYLTLYLESGAKKDSATIADGRFIFKGASSIPVTGILTTSHTVAGFNNYLNFLVEPANILLEGKGDTLNQLSITGSAINDANRKLKDQMKPVSDWEERNNKIYEAAYKEKNRAVMDSLDEVSMDIMKARRKVVGEFIRANPSSLRGAMAIEQYFGYYAEADEVEPLYNALSENIKNSTTGIKIKKMLDIYKQVAIGMPAPEISQWDTSGNLLNLSSLKGRYVLVDFWASWCGPCRRENPNIVKAYNKFHPKGLEILGVSYDNEKGKGKWTRAIIDDNLTWKQVSDLKGWANATSSSYYIKAIPSNVLLDKEGRIIAKNLFGKKLADKLAELMP